MLHRIKKKILREVDRNKSAGGSHKKKSAGEFGTRHERMIIRERSLTATEFQELRIPSARNLTGVPHLPRLGQEIGRTGYIHTGPTPRQQSKNPGIRTLRAGKHQAQPGIQEGPLANQPRTELAGKKRRRAEGVGVEQDAHLREGTGGRGKGAPPAAVATVEKSGWAR